MMQDRNLQLLFLKKKKTTRKMQCFYYCTFHLTKERVYLLKSELAKEMWKISSISLQKNRVDVLKHNF